MKNDWSRMPTGDVVVYDDNDETCRYQVTCIRNWDVTRRLTLIPASDPRALLWFGACEHTHPRGHLMFYGFDGSRAYGEEALVHILNALPNGPGRMFADFLGEPASGQGEPGKTIWPCEIPREQACGECPRFNERGELNASGPMGN